MEEPIKSTGKNITKVQRVQKDTQNLFSKSQTLYPAFSANALTTDSSPSAYDLIAYCSKPGHVYKVTITNGIIE